MIVLDHEDGYQRQIHSIENTPFRTKFEDDIVRFHGTSAIGCISDADPQPLLVRSHLGTFAITTIGAINNAEALVEEYFEDHDAQFMALSSGAVNSTELVAALINQKDDLVAGIQYAQSKIDGSLTLLIMTEDGDIIAARDFMGRLPVLVGADDDGHCVAFESFAYHKLGYHDEYELGPAEIVRLTPDAIEVLSPARDRDENVRVHVGVLRLSELQLRGYERGSDALPQRCHHGSRRGSARRVPRGGLRGRRARFRHPPCHRLFDREQDALRSSVYQVHTHLAAVVHAGEPGSAQQYRQHEAGAVPELIPRQEALVRGDSIVRGRPLAHRR